MNEIEKLIYTKDFIHSLASGVNPIDNTPIPAEDLMNNVRISRCLYYVSDILEQVIEEGGTKKIKKKMPAKEAFDLSDEERMNFNFSDSPVSVSEITRRMNDTAAIKNRRKMSVKTVNDWLEFSGFLESTVNEEGRRKRYPTQTGTELGLIVEKRQGFNGKYYDVVLFSKEAQQFIIDSLDGLIDYVAFTKR